MTDEMIDGLFDHRGDPDGMLRAIRSGKHIYVFDGRIYDPHYLYMFLKTATFKRMAETGDLAGYLKDLEDYAAVEADPVADTERLIPYLRALIENDFNPMVGKNGKIYSATMTYSGVEYSTKDVCEMEDERALEDFVHDSEFFYYLFCLYNARDMDYDYPGREEVEPWLDQAFSCYYRFGSGHTIFDYLH